MALASYPIQNQNPRSEPRSDPNHTATLIWKLVPALGHNRKKGDIINQDLGAEKGHAEATSRFCWCHHSSLWMENYSRIISFDASMQRLLCESFMRQTLRLLLTENTRCGNNSINYPLEIKSWAILVSQILVWQCQTSPENWGGGVVLDDYFKNHS